MDPLSEVVAVGEFLAEHADLVGVIRDALKGGVSKEQMMKDIRASMVAASDAAMKAELGATP